MTYQSRVSEAVVRRLPMYYRHLQELEKAGVERISSRELGEQMNLTASQIRQDINCYGGFGQQGYGYHVSDLRKHIKRILGLGKTYKAIIVGAGNIGRAIARYTGFKQEGFQIEAIFDEDPSKIGESFDDYTVLSINEMETFIQNHPIDIGIIAVPAEGAQEVADKLIACGIEALWNFAPVELRHSNEVVTNDVQLSDSLHILTYKMNEESLFRKSDPGENE